LGGIRSNSSGGKSCPFHVTPCVSCHPVAARDGASMRVIPGPVIGGTLSQRRTILHFWLDRAEKKLKAHAEFRGTVCDWNLATRITNDCQGDCFLVSQRTVRE
jgi:hypothetical protein